MFARFRLSAGAHSNVARLATLGSSAAFVAQQLDQRPVACVDADPNAPPWHLGNVQLSCSGHDSVAGAFKDHGLDNPSTLAAVDGGGLCSLPLAPDSLQFLEDIVMTRDPLYTPLMGNVRTDVTIMARAMLAHRTAYEQAMVPPPPVLVAPVAAPAHVALPSSLPR